MPKEIFTNQIESDEKIFDLKGFLSRLTQITPEDVKNFRDSRVLPEKIESFDRSWTEEDKIKAVAIDSLPEIELDKLVELAKNSEYVAGLHECRTELRHLFFLTNDQKYSSKRYLRVEP